MCGGAMTLGGLKKIRRAVSVALLIPISLVFLDVTGVLPSGLITGILAFQFLPAFAHSLHLLGLPALGVLFILLVTFLFGRVYCSTLCPLGTLQDVIGRLARKAGRRLPDGPLPEYNVLRYGLLALTVLSLGSGAMIVVSLLDPFSGFGREVSGLARPLFIGANNGAAWVLEGAGSYALYPLRLRGIGWLSVAAPALLLVVTGWLAWTRGRLYCNTMCPVGTLLGLLSRRARYRITIHDDECIGCGACAQVCKAGCIDTERKSVDMSRCVACYNCFPECPSGGITYGRPALREPDRTDVSRRRFLRGSVTGLAALAGAPPETLRTIVATKDATVPVVRSTPVAPPGAGGIARFTARCTACHVCISACPAQVLVPAFLDYGLPGILQPQMDYRISYCIFDCTRCGEVCPSGALLPLAQERKHVTQLGAAKFVKDNCIVFTEGTECGACSEHCPTKAVRMVPYKRLMAPEVKEEYCVGCGACEFACPTKPHKAIYVEGRPLHTTAEKPPREERLHESTGDFPF